MRLLLLNYEFPPFGGGASSASYYLALAYAKQGHRVDVLTSRTRGQPRFEEIGGIRVHRVASWRKSAHEAGLLGAATYVLGASGRLRTLLRRHHYDHAQIFFALPTGLLSFLWRRMSDRPYVICLRGSDVPGYDSSFKDVAMLHRLLRPLSVRVLDNASAVVANSESLRRLALESYPEVPISVITNGVSETDYRPGEEAARNTSRLCALCVSRLVDRKGIDILLRALERCNDQRLFLKIAGTGAEADKLESLARELGLSNRVAFLGQQSAQQLMRHYREVDFLVHPALAESFSMTLLEAMSSGLPVVSTNAGGIPELITHGENGLLCPPGDVQALSEAMQTMSADADLRARLSKANRCRILRAFTWDRIAERYLEDCFAAADASGHAELERTT